MKRIRGEEGVALIMVLWVIAILSVVVLEFSFGMRTELKMTMQFRDELQPLPTPSHHPPSHPHPFQRLSLQRQRLLPSILREEGFLLLPPLHRRLRLNRLVKEDRNEEGPVDVQRSILVGSSDPYRCGGDEWMFRDPSSD